MELIDVWVVYANSGERDKGKPTHAFSTDFMANTFAHGRGWGGGLSVAPVEKRRAIRSNTGDVYLLDDQIEQPVDLDGLRTESEEQERQEALAKLTPRQRQLLGIK